MRVISVSAERVIEAPAATIHGILADLNERPSFLPPAFSAFRVESGGLGTGTIVTFDITAGGRNRHYRMQVEGSEPGTLVERDLGSSLVTTFTVTSQPDGSLVRILTTWQGAPGIGGFFERRFAPKVMARLYADELVRLEQFVLARMRDDAVVDEASRESFPASDPPAY